jgi:hypothetical protein
MTARDIGAFVAGALAGVVGFVIVVVLGMDREVS